MPRADRASRRSWSACAREMWRPRFCPPRRCAPLCKRAWWKFMSRASAAPPPFCAARRCPTRPSPARRGAPYPNCAPRWSMAAAVFCCTASPARARRRSTSASCAGRWKWAKAPSSSCRRSPSRRRWSRGSTSASARTRPSSIPAFRRARDSTNGGASARARRAWSSARARRCSPRLRMWASSSSMRNTRAATSPTAAPATTPAKSPGSVRRARARCCCWAAPRRPSLRICVR